MYFNGNRPVVCADFKPSVDEFEKAISAMGARTQYIKAFSEQDMSGMHFRLGLIKPNPVNSTGGSITQMFQGYKGKSLPTGIRFEWSDGYRMKKGFANYLFSYCSKLEEIPDINIPYVEYAQRFFYNCLKLRKIEKFRIHKTTDLTSAFDRCESLEELTITGEIGTNGLNLSWSTKLTHESLMNVLNCLEDKSTDTSGTVWKVTIGSENLAKLLPEEIAEANAKGWTLV